MESQESPRIRPRLVVFDLDHTLWPWYVDDYYYEAPYRKCSKTGRILDKSGKHMAPFPEVMQVLERLHNDGIDLGIASRTCNPEGANSLIELFDWDKFFRQKEIYPGCKIGHFKKFQKATGYRYEEMLFFDDESRNIKDTKSLGVRPIHVHYDTGVTMEGLDIALEEFAALSKASNSIGNS